MAMGMWAWANSNSFQFQFVLLYYTRLERRGAQLAKKNKKIPVCRSRLPPGQPHHIIISPLQRGQAAAKS